MKITVTNLLSNMGDVDYNENDETFDNALARAIREGLIVRRGDRYYAKDAAPRSTKGDSDASN